MMMMMEAARTSETLVNFYQTIRRYNPEDRHLPLLMQFSHLPAGVLPRPIVGYLHL
jgi:hypothetical protein